MSKILSMTIAAGLCLMAITAGAESADALRKQAQDLRKRMEQDKENSGVTEDQVRNLYLQANLLDLEKILPQMKSVKPKQPRKLLVYSRTQGFRHQSIPFAAAAFKRLGEKTGAFTVEATEDEKIFTSGRLDEFDGILMLSTTGGDPVPRGEGQKAFEAFLAKKHGLIGIHAATDCHADWKNYREAMGGLFDGHPWGAGHMLTLLVEEPEHPLCRDIPQGYRLKDEIYQYKDDEHFTREKLRILVSLDLAGENMKCGGMKRADNDYAVSWVRKYDQSRVFYSNLGHNEFTFYDAVAMQHFLTGIQFALGDIEADHRPSAEVGNGTARPLPENF